MTEVFKASTYYRTIYGERLLFLGENKLTAEAKRFVFSGDNNILYQYQADEIEGEWIDEVPEPLPDYTIERISLDIAELKQLVLNIAKVMQSQPAIISPGEPENNKLIATRKRWRKAEIELLQGLRKRGFKRSEIARQLGRTPHAISTFISNELGGIKGERDFWVNEKRALLKKLYAENKSIKELAAFFKKSEGSIEIAIKRFIPNAK